MKPRNLNQWVFTRPFWTAMFVVSALLLISFSVQEHPPIKPDGMVSKTITNVFPHFDGAGDKRGGPEILHIDPTANYARWKGDFQYRLDYRDDLYENSVEFLKMKGLRGETYERIEVTGQIVFTQAKKKVRDRMFNLPGHFAGQGTVSYSIARMSLSKLGEGQMVHFIDGKGKEQIKRRREDTFLKINRAGRTYSIRISPGAYEADIDAFGVKVLATTEMKVTNAFIEKMESVGRPVLYPEELKEMFPEYNWRQDRDHIVLEAFDMPLPGSGNTLIGSYTDEKGGVLSWKFTAF